MNLKKIKKTVWIILYIFALAFLVYYIHKYAGTSVSVLTLHMLPYFIVAIILDFFAFTTVAFAWAYMITRQYKDIPVIPLLRSYYTSQLIRYIPGNIWSFIARFENVNKLGVKKSAVAFFLAVENINLILTAVVFAVFSLNVLKGGYFITLVCAGIILTGALVGLFLKPELFRKVVNVFAAKFKSEIRYDNLSKKELTVVLVLFACYWILFGLSFYVLTLGELGTKVPVFLAIGINAAAWVVGYLSIVTPSGLGVREGIIVLFLLKYTTSTIGFGIAILARLVFVISEVLGLVVILLFERIRHTP